MADLIHKLRAALGDRYEVYDEIGRGGMSVVFAAREAKFDRQVAIKVLRPELAAAIGNDRFLREIKITGALQHPNILPMFESDEKHGLLYYTLPLLEGESLQARIERERQLPIADAIEITSDVCKALSYAHGQGYVHRDIKPSNVMFAAGRAMLLDFGIGRAIDLAGADRITESGLAVGTPAYMSPEQGSAGERLDGRSDIYSLGTVLFEMLSGEPPFTGATASAVLARHAAESPPSLRVVRRGVSPALQFVVEKALAKVPADRFQTALEFERALANPERAAPASVTTRPRYRGKVAGAVGFAVMLIAAVVFSRTPRLPAVGVQDLNPRHVAVLPFDHPDDDESLADVAGGLTRDLINALQTVGELTLISESGVRGFDAATPIDSVVQLRDVGTVVLGSVEPLGTDSMRVDVRVVAGETAVLLGTIRDTRARNQSILMRDTVVARVADRLRIILGSDIRMRELRAGASNDSAWRLYQHARQLTGRRDSASYAAAVPLLEAAHELDGSWAEPMVTRGEIEYHLGTIWVGEEKSRYFDRALSFADQALLTQPDYAPALALKGAIRFMQWVQVDSLHVVTTLEQAERELSRSTSLDPRQARAWNTLSSVRGRLGDSPGAVDAAVRAVDADPYLEDVIPTLNRLVFAYLDQEKFDSARTMCFEGSHRFPESRPLRYCRLTVLAYAGAGAADIDSAWSALAWAQANPMAPLLKDSIDALGYFDVAIVVARSGLADSARSMAARIRGLLETAGRADDMLITEAHLWTVTGDHDVAMELLNRALENDPRRADFVATVSWFRPLRGRSDFSALVGFEP